MKKIFRCYYLTFKNTDSISSVCSFLDENDNEICEPRIYAYLADVMHSNIYWQEIIDKYLNIVEQAEKNSNEDYGGVLQNFSLEISAKEVIFYHNEFDEIDGFPVLSCPLHIFKQVITAWSLFLQLPKSKHTLLETEIFEEDPSLKSRND